MLITYLKASEVHGYLPIDIRFFADITFLTGLNGSGKTSALRLLMGLLTPQLDELTKMSFRVAEVGVHDSGNDIVVRAIRDKDSFSLSISTLEDSLVLSNIELQIFAETKDKDDGRIAAAARVQQHPVFQAIHAMSTPMFLSLDRKFQYPEVRHEGRHEAPDHRRALLRRMLEHDLMRTTATAGIDDVNQLISERLTDIRAQQSQLDDRLRDQLLLSTFKYTHSDTPSMTMPSRDVLETYKQRQAKVSQAAKRLSLPVSEVQAALALLC